MSGRAVLAVVVLAAIGGACSQPPEAPGPAQRAGAAIDRTVATVQDELDEASLKAKVRVALLEQLRTDGLEISADVSGSVVTLTGRVEPAFQPGAGRAGGQGGERCHRGPEPTRRGPPDPADGTARSRRRRGRA